MGVCWLLVLFSGCGSDEQHGQNDLAVPQDLAAAFDLTAAACAPPTNVPDPCVLDIQLKNYENLSLGGSLVEMRARSDDHVIVSGTADSNGNVQLSAASGGKPIDAYLIAHPTTIDGGVLPTSVLELASGLHSSQLQILIESEAILESFGSLAGVTWDTSNELTVVDASRCNSTGQTGMLTGATISISPGDTVYYADNLGKFSATQTATSTVGEGASFNTPPGAITVGVEYDGQSASYASHARAGVFHYLYVYP
jgi:hypothetical protein